MLLVLVVVVVVVIGEPGAKGALCFFNEENEEFDDDIVFDIRFKLKLLLLLLLLLLLICMRPVLVCCVAVLNVVKLFCVSDGIGVEASSNRS